MPTGLVDALSHQERLDLVRFLAALGKPGTYDASQGTVARHWQLIPVTIDLAQFGEEKIFDADIRGRDWLPAATTVDGRLLRSDLKTAVASKAWRNPQDIVAATQFDLARPGRIQLNLDRPPGTPAWIDGVPLDNPGVSDREWPAGRHTLMLKIDARNLPEHVRASVDQGTFAVE
jgi:hypothetical protein